VTSGTEGQVGHMTGYSFSTPAVATGARNVNGPEDETRDWDAIDWRAHEGRVRRLRRRIFKATQERDWAQVRSLQKMMVRHEARVSRMGVKDRHRLIVVAVG
jgi:Fe-S cluster biosynthesis and repair protein YggX